MKKDIAKWFSLGMGVLLLSWLLAQLDVAEVLAAIRAIPPSLLLLGFASYLAGFAFRAIRFRLLLPKDQPVRHLLPIVLAHYAALNLIPARLGELSYIFLLKKVNQISTGRSVSNLLAARVFDHVTISTMFLVSVCFLDVPTPWIKTLSLTVSGLFVATCALIALLFAYQSRYVLWLRGVLRVLKLERSPLAQRVLRVVEDVVEALAALRIAADLAKILAVSLLIWLSIFASNYFLLHAFQVNFAFHEVIFSSTCVILLRFLPLQLVSGFGIHETSWVFLAQALGISRQTAITAVFGSHLIATFYLVCFGGYGLFRLARFLDLPFGKPAPAPCHDDAQ